MAGVRFLAGSMDDLAHALRCHQGARAQALIIDGFPGRDASGVTIAEYLRGAVVCRQSDRNRQGRGLAVQREYRVHFVQLGSERQRDRLALGDLTQGRVPLVLHGKFDDVATASQHLIGLEHGRRIGGTVYPYCRAADTPARTDMIRVVTLAVILVVADSFEKRRIPLVDDRVAHLLEPRVDAAYGPFTA